MIMNKKRLSLSSRFPSVVLLSLALLYGCTPGKGPLLMIQVCVKDDQGVTELMNMMRSITASEHMTFVDGSAETQRELQAAIRRRQLRVEAV
jgi:hypothetical protein